MGWIERDHDELGRIRWRFDWNLSRDAVKVEMERLEGPGYCIRTAKPYESQAMLLSRAEQSLIDYLQSRG